MASFWLISEGQKTPTSQVAWHAVQEEDGVLTVTACREEESRTWLLQRTAREGDDWGPVGQSLLQLCRPPPDRVLIRGHRSMM